MEIYGNHLSHPENNQKGEEPVGLPVGIYAEILLLNEMPAQNIGNAEPARRMEIRPQEVQRITSLNHPTEIDTAVHALKQSGCRLNIGLQAV